MGGIAKTVSSANEAIQKALIQELGKYAPDVSAEAKKNVDAKKQEQAKQNGSAQYSHSDENIQKLAQSIVQADMKGKGAAYANDVIDVLNKRDEDEIRGKFSKGTSNTTMDKIRDYGLQDKSSTRDKSIWRDFKKEYSEEERRKLYDAMHMQYLKYAQGTIKNGGDAVISAEGKPMTIAASKITPINDGVVEYGDMARDDVGVIGQPGGIWDTLFKGVFGKIDSTYNILKSISSATGLNFANSEKISKIRNEIFERNRVEHSILPREDALEKIYNEWSSPREYVKNIGNNYNSTVENTAFNGKRDVNVHINGRLMLDCGNQSVDVIGIIQNNPMIVRRITEHVADQIYKNQNGGKTEGPGAGVRYASMA